MYLIVNKHNIEVYNNLEFAAKRLGVVGGGDIYRFPSEQLAMAKKCELDPQWKGDAKFYPSPVEGVHICTVSGFSLVQNTVFPNVVAA
jgi:hypothetical protein